MAKVNKTATTNSDNPEDNTNNGVTPEGDKELVVSENENNIDNNASIPETNMASNKTNEDIYREIQALKPKAKFQEYFTQAEKALKEGTTIKRKVITIVSSNLSIPYEDIVSNIAYAIKKYKLSFMFELTAEQQKLLEEQNLFWFAQKRF